MSEDYGSPVVEKAFAAIELNGRELEWMKLRTQLHSDLVRTFGIPTYWLKGLLEHARRDHKRLKRQGKRRRLK